MANYYTYGVVPTVEETVFGPLSAGYANGGEVDDERENTMPTGEDEPVSPLDQAAPSNNQPYVPDWAKNIIAFGAAPRLIPDLTTAGTGGKKSATQEMFAKRQSEIAEKDKAIRDRLSSIGRLTPETEQELDKSLSYNLNKLAEEEKEYVSTLPQRDTLSGLLQEGKFKEAYKFAEDNGLQKLITDPSQLKNLRDPFTKEEGKAFINAMPSNFLQKAFNIDDDSFKKGYEFDPQGAEGRGAFAWVTPGKEGPVQSETGFPDLGRVLQHKEIQKEMTPFDKLIRAVVYAGMAFAGASALGLTGGLTGAGAAGTGTAGAGAAGAGTAAGGLSGISSAVKTFLAIPETIGIKIGEALGFNTLSTLQAKMIGNAVISGGVTGAKGGDIGDILKSAVLSAGFTFVSDKAINAAVKAMQDSGLIDSAAKVGKALESGVEVIDDGTASSITQSVIDGLDQVNVITNTGGALTNAATTVAAVAASQPSVDEPEVKVETTRDQVEPPATVVEPPLSQETPVEEPTPTEEEEVVVETEKEPEVTTPPVVTPPTSPIDEAVPEKEVVVETEREPEVTAPPVVTPPTSPIDEAVPEEEVVVETERDKPTPPVVTPPPQGPEEKVVVETERDKPTPPVVTPPPEGPEEEVVVETERDKPTPPVTTPTEPPKDTDKDPDKDKDKNNLPISWEDLLKLILAFQSTKKPTAPPTSTAPPPGGLGGALPKYTLTRQQLRPDIDYYTYGTRPEAKFFEDKLQLEKPVQPPATTPTPEPEEEPKAAGGLAGYAKGGSNSSRYVAGPGSGREDKIPALLSDGEYVIDAETLALLGDGSTKEGARRMDSFRANIRKHKGRALSRGRISPNAKSPDKYMGGGLT